MKLEISRNMVKCYLKSKIEPPKYSPILPITSFFNKYKDYIEKQVIIRKCLTKFSPVALKLPV